MDNSTIINCSITALGLGVSCWCNEYSLKRSLTIVLTACLIVVIYSALSAQAVAINAALLITILPALIYYAVIGCMIYAVFSIGFKLARLI